MFDRQHFPDPTGADTPASPDLCRYTYVDLRELLVDTSTNTFRMLLRSSQPYARRVLLFMAHTRCQPSEVISLRWADVDLVGGIARLAKGRCLALPPLLIRLLSWMTRNDGRTWHGRRAPAEPTSRMLRRILEQGPISAKKLYRRLRPLGVTRRMIWQAKRTAGARCRWLGKGRGWLYTLPETARAPSADDVTEAYVFLNERGLPWRYRALTLHLSRLQKRLELPESVSLCLLRYSLIEALKHAGLLRSEERRTP